MDYSSRDIRPVQVSRYTHCMAAVNSLQTWLAVAAGGALGSSLRYAVSTLLNRPAPGFPFGTLAVNLAGCLAIGFCWQTLAGASTTVKALVFVGILGGFTTFSSFGIETMRMVKAGQHGEALLYIGLSNGLGLAMVWLGWLLGKLPEQRLFVP